MKHSGRISWLPLGRGVLATIALIAAPALTAAEGFAPAEAEANIKSLPGTRVKLFASEPEVRQAIFVKCDDRGRVWTIQYLQYPNPAGLERVQVDRWSRTVYDRVPEPPPKGPRGADRITILTDNDGDGRADEAKDFVEGLNLCTGVEFGHGGVYVLQVPYLLFYPDRNRDDVPDGDPEVLLQGFGMEDAQAMVNHLTWGPDGWLYGVNGSTTTCNINGIEFQQGCWRYHPVTKEFELFSEGGLNVYGLTFNANGELFYSTNGGPFVHAMQGAYYYKSFGKHGPLHNLFAYHYFPQQECDQVPGGPPTGGTIYLADALPQKLRGTFVAGNFLGHTVSWWEMAPNGSTFGLKYGGVLFDIGDAWGGPTDFCVGPDGCAYVSDFFDRRTAHPDPDANWDRSNGRIYRVEAADGAPPEKCDIGALSSAELVKLLSHRNQWYAARARVELAGRRDESIVPTLCANVRQQEDDSLALQSLWALHVTSGLDAELAVELLSRDAPYLRYWAVRLLCDPKQVEGPARQALLDLARTETHPVVLGQLAASAKRLDDATCLELVDAMLSRKAGASDSRIPWLLWWAIESKAMTATEPLIARFAKPDAWDNAMLRDNGLRLLRRWSADGSQAGYDASARLAETVPGAQRNAALEAIRQGLAERSQGYEEITQGGLFDQQAARESAIVTRERREFQPLVGPLREMLIDAWRANPEDPLALELALRTGDESAYTALVRTLGADDKRAFDPVRRLELVREFGRDDVVSLLLSQLNAKAAAVEFASTLDALARFDSPEIATTLESLYGSLDPENRRAARDTLLARPDSAIRFLRRIEQGEFSTGEIGVEELRRVATLHSGEADALVRTLWGNVGPGSTEEKLATMRRFANDLRAGAGTPANGRLLFTKHCGTCHQLHGEGAKIGPDLTTANRQDQAALLANLVDPSAVIRREYVVNVVVTTSGRVESGILADQDGAGVTLLTAENKRIQIPRDEIEDISESELSIMPERLLEGLTPQERRDLFAYLQQP